jgi:hypothetical protein
MTDLPGDGDPPRDPYVPPTQGYGQGSGQGYGQGSGQQYGQGQAQEYGYGQWSAQPYGGPGQDHPRAALSLILGVLGFVTCAVASPFAWRIGKRTMQEIDASQGRLGGRGVAQAGYVLGLIGTVVLVIGVVAMALLVAGLFFLATTSTSPTVTNGLGPLG